MIRNWKFVWARYTPVSGSSIMQGTAETCVDIKPRSFPRTFRQAFWKNDPLPYFTKMAWRTKNLSAAPAADGRDERMKTPDM